MPAPDVELVPVLGVALAVELVPVLGVLLGEPTPELPAGYGTLTRAPML